MLMESKNEISELKAIKDFDLYTHMKRNMWEFEKNCSDESKSTIYCIDCKYSTCNLCKTEDHGKHQYILKMNYYMEEQSIEKNFSEIEKSLFEEIFSNTEKVKLILTDSVNKYIDNLHRLLDEIRNKKLKEIENMFVNYELNIFSLKQKITEVKENILSFYNKNREFFSLGENKDLDNSVFLMSFDLMNISMLKNKEIQDVMKKIKSNYSSYLKDNSEKFDKLTNMCEEFLKDPQKKRIDRRLSLNECDLRVVNHPEEFKNNSNKLNNDFFKDVKTKSLKYDDHIDNFKRNVFDSYSKNGSFKEIDKT